MKPPSHPGDRPIAVSAAAVLELVNRPACLVALIDDLLDRVARAEVLAEAADAAHRAYDDALSDYEQLMRHRLANPVQTVLGMARTLLDMPDLEAATRTRMVEAIHEQALALRTVCVEPRRVSDVERELDPTPRLPGAVRHG